ncbi:Outer membrane protein Imp [Rubellimicrobium mesophilum DSM 19309]|uniref:LPS-assembly protein LptD n=1 Tax=Rubellimicrobium mesophilum DSM 19309 TaxID=442562 RepID=A0A017HJX5_9RHOB|nr:LPS assembly protein LptD [Rubellimicrobium mesophilum]EYD74463.1 Outer membrane protein Imp [Rubellimicrobium mesophilum DSM 19309]
MRRLLALLLALLPLAAPAQESAVLVADTLVVTQDERLVATGNVQAFYEGTTLSAAEVAYDRAADRLTIEGPILIRDADGTVVTAERAELDPRLEDGLLRGARLVLDRQLQLAANRVDRLDGLTALTGAAASSCQVCPGTAPLWEIRAEQVIHDEAAEQLYFENARFLVRGVPIFWVPRMRLPDPNNERATGLLIPRIRTTDDLGVGLKLPYFIELGPTRDLTLTPYLSRQTRTLEARYRQAFLRGDLQVEGAVSRDDLTEGPRGFVTARGAFDLGDRLDLLFHGTAVSDKDYLLDYGYSDDDRLETSVRLSRVGQTSLFAADVTQYRSLRQDEREGPLPPVVAQLSWEKRNDALGGTVTLGVGLDGFARTASGSGEASRDVTRAGAFAGWRADRVLGPGVLIEGEARAALDAYRVADDPAYAESFLRASPAAAVTLRWPLIRHGTQAGSDLLEPVASLGWTGAFGNEPPNEDSRLPEFDEANLHALSRLPGEDEVETGGRLSLGLSWTRTGPGFSSTLAVGRVLRTEALEASQASGLSGMSSDWLLAEGLDLAGGFAFDLRTLFHDDLADFRPGKTEARLDWSNDAITLGTAYLHVPADAEEDRPDTAAEILFDAELRPSERWTIQGDTRYDLEADRPARVGLGLGWRNECVEVDVSVARRYTSADDGGPSTDFGLSVNLNGFSAGRQARVTPGACRG